MTKNISPHVMWDQHCALGEEMEETKKKGEKNGERKWEREDNKER